MHQKAGRTIHLPLGVKDFYKQSYSQTGEIILKIGICFVYMDFHRNGKHHRGVLQPQIGPLIAALLPPDVEVEVINDTWEDPDFSRDYDLLFIASMHSDFDRARQISHYWRRRGAKTVYGGIMASTYPQLCQPFFDSVVIGDPEGCVQQVYRDFSRNELKPRYLSAPYDAEQVPTPRLDLLAGKQVVPITLEATRGCPFSCEFCALSGLGTRFHIRSPELLVRDIKAAQNMLRGLVPTYQLYMAVFNDNNIGGNLSHLKKLCDAITPLKMYWGSAITFNAISDPDVVKALAKAGCNSLFVGLESFNQESISDMNKVQNSIDQTKRVIDQCRKHGIILLSGMMLNPMTDDERYLRTIPARLQECGLYLPSFVCFECPIPGTPHFYRVAAQPEPAFLPNALLRDFNGYTLVTRPKRERVETFIESYQWINETVFSLKNKAGKLAADLPTLLANKHWGTAAYDVVLNKVSKWNPHPQRTYLAGTDVPPPEASSVPLTDHDFASETERSSIMEPWSVTDAEGRVLPQWLSSTKVFEAKGRLSERALELVA